MTKNEALKLALEALENIKNDPFKFDLKNQINKSITAIKEALAQPEQEPLGFMNAGHVHEMQQGRLPYGYVYPKKESGTSVAVYITPPQRKPLTDEQIKAIFESNMKHDISDAFGFARAIEAAHGIKGEA